MYLSYEEYISYGGTLDETTFNDLEFEASAVVDWYTFNRLKNDTQYPEALKRCMYKLIQYIIAQQQASGLSDANTSSGGVAAGIASQSNDGVSISYNLLSARDIVENSKAQMAQIINQYLSAVVNSLGRKVLYRGLYPNE